MNKIKILIRIASLEGGGSEKSLIFLLKNINHSKYEVDLLLNCKTGPYLNDLPKEVKLYYLIKGDEFLSSTLWIRSIQKTYYFFKGRIFERFLLIYFWTLRNKNYDVEIAFTENMAIGLVRSPLKSKKLAWVHIDLEEKANYNMITEREKELTLSCLNKMNTIIVVSKQCRDVLFSLSPELMHKTHMIYNPIDIDELIRQSNEFHLEEKHGKIKLLAMGRLVLQKGFDRLINVCHKLRKQGFDFELCILGEGPDRNKLSDQIRALELDDIVKLVGYKINPYPYVRAADIFVMSSRYESMSYVVLEALILNKPIISTDVVGPPELLKGGELGLLVENSEEKLYEGLKRMILDNEFRESFIHKEKDFSAFDPKYIAQQVEKVIDSL
ncbi:MAG: glycosyltransferase [Flavobacteriales bacterium]